MFLGIWRNTENCYLGCMQSLQNLMFYTDAEKHIWHNDPRSAGCDLMPSVVSISLPVYLSLVWLFHSLLSQNYHKYQNYLLPLLNLFLFWNCWFLGERGGCNCCWAFITLIVYFEMKKNIVLNKTMYWYEQLRSKVRMHVLTCMQAKWGNLGIWYYTDESFCPWDCEICHRCTFRLFSPFS